MNIKEIVKINKKIMKLIESKYPNEFPPAYTDTDYRYYMKLQKDVDAAERHLDLAKSK